MLLPNNGNAKLQNLSLTSRHLFEVNELDCPCLAHGLHRINDVVLQSVDPVFLVQTNSSHGLLTHGTLVSITRTLQEK